MEDYFNILAYPMWVTSLVSYYLTLILCVPGNAFVLYVAGLKMKRTVTMVGFLNLAIADLLCCLSTLCYVTERTLAVWIHHVQDSPLHYAHHHVCQCFHLELD
ncbi:hypothetical protein QQF64_002828 [Cirrhinus molitorella]|uniref:G-protein coupled receptors family 1 profile domain-containing protein n=1 Tax=Cirrhinus molitorella TaxID=172907 RepID=A0ABR3MR84_9TELE